MHEQDFGSSTPDAAAALSLFAFLIGRCRCGAMLRSDGGKWQTLPAAWEGRFILGGHAIADEDRMTSPAGELLVFGMNFRVYDSTRKAWNIKWLDALTGTWLDLGPDDRGGVRIEGGSIVSVFREPVVAHTYTRATYANITATHFTWRGERSDDGKA